MMFESLFDIVKEFFLKADVRDIYTHMAFEFRVQGEPSGVFYLEIKEGQISVEPYEYHDRDALLTLDSETLLEICYGHLKPMLAYVVGRLKVEGDLGKVQVISKVLV